MTPSPWCSIVSFRSRTVLLLLLPAVLLVMTGCSKKKNGAAQSETNASDPCQAAVTVNGVVYTNGQVDAQLEQVFQQTYGNQIQQLSPMELNQRKKEMRRNIIETLVVEQLLDGQVKKDHIDANEADMNAKLAREVGPNVTVASVTKQLQAADQDPNAMLEQLRKATCYDKLFDRQCQGHLDVNEADIETYYAANKNTTFNIPEKRRCRHILIDPKQIDPNGDPNTADKMAKAEIEKLLQQARNGADFAQLAREHSNGPSAAQGGDLGYFGRNDMVEPFASAAFALDVNQVSDVVKTKYGYHIIQLLDIQPPHIQTLTEARESIVKHLTSQKKARILNAYLKSLKAAADIQYADQSQENTRG